MAYNENPNPENLQRQEIEIIEEEMRRERESWLKAHMTWIYAGIGVIVVALVALLISVYYRSTNPMSRFVSAASKALDSSFSFTLTADKNDQPVMSFEGSIKTDLGLQNIKAEYTADYDDYSYSKVLYTDGAKTYKGVLLNDEWHIGNATERVQEYLDFYTDFRTGGFDGGSFLRFTGLNNRLYSIELNKFVGTLRDRFSTDSSLTKITVTRDGSDTTYHNDVNLPGLLDFIRDNGAPVFYTLPDYNSFVAKLEENTENIEASSCEFSFTINGAGYLKNIDLLIDTGSDSYHVRCELSDFDDADPEIPDTFFEAAGLK